MRRSTDEFGSRRRSNRVVTTSSTQSDYGRGSVDTLVLIGTTKGLFALRSGDGREQFELTGPTFPGEEVYSTCIDTRGATPGLYTGSVSNHWGPVLRRSDDLGASWSEDERASLAFPEGSDASLARIWQLTPGPADQPDVVYAGVEPAALFRSDDGGTSFSLVRGLWDHPHRPQWEPGGGGLCLHTVLVHPDDPDRLLIAISAAGVYLSDDGGDSWRASNAGIARPLHARLTRAGVRAVRPQGRTRRRRPRAALPSASRWHLPQRRRRWVMDGDDGHRRHGLRVPGRRPPDPTRHGLPAAARERRVPVHTERPLHGVAYGRRWSVVGSRSRTGSPKHDAHLTVLRDAFTTDGQDPAGLYFGTRTGEVYGSIDDGDSWRVLADHLPPVVSVRAASVG